MAPGMTDRQEAVLGGLQEVVGPSASVLLAEMSPHFKSDPPHQKFI